MNKNKIRMIKIILLALISVIFAGGLLLDSKRGKEQDFRRITKTETEVKQEQDSEDYPDENLLFSPSEKTVISDVKIIHTDTFIETIMGAYQYLLKEKLESYMEKFCIQAEIAECFLYERYDSSRDADIFYIELLPGKQIVRSTWYNEKRELNLEEDQRTREQIESALGENIEEEQMETTEENLNETENTQASEEGSVQNTFMNISITDVPVELVEQFGNFAEKLPEQLAEFLKSHQITGITTAKYIGNLQYLEQKIQFWIQLDNTDETVVVVIYENENYNFNILKDENA